MENTKFSREYEKNRLPLVHVLGVIGNGIFIFICYYEFGILYRLWGSLAWALVVPPFLELTQWFFAEIAVKQKIFEEQQAQLRLLNDHMTEFCMGERNQALRDGERADFIEKNNLLLLRGVMIPPSAINGFLLYSFVVATLVGSMVIITFNRNESNQKVIDMEVKTALSVLDSTNNEEIETERENYLAAINLIAVTGSVDVEQANKLTAQVQGLDGQIATAKAGKEVIKMAKLKKERNALLEKFNSLPLSKEYEKQKATRTKEFTGWKKQKEDENKAFKTQKEKQIRDKYVSKGTRINWLAIITNILYVIFQYVIIKIRTITGSWSFDMIEFIGSYLSPKQTTENIQIKIDELEIVPEKKEVVAPSVNEVKEVVTNKNAVEVKEVKIVNLVEPKPKTEPVKPQPQQAAISYENSRHSVHYETMKLSHLQQFFEENDIKLIGYDSAEQIWSCLKNGRKAIIDGRLESKSVQTMNNLLNSLADNYGIVANPTEKKIETRTPQLVKKVIQSKSKIV